MKSNQLLFSAFLLLFINLANAQEFKLGKVSIEELQQKVHPKDSSAVAAILFKKGSTSFEFSDTEGFKVVTKVGVRIKIYKNEGLEWANQEVIYRIGSVDEKISFSNEVTYNLVNGIIEKTKLKNEGEFVEHIDKYRDKKKITMPNVKAGSVIEYEYYINSPNIGSLRDWNFQSSIPVNYSEYSTYIPEYFIYNSNQKGSVFPKITTEKRPKSITMNSKERSVGRLTTTTTFSQDKLDFMETKNTYILENVPAIKDEVFVNNVANYMSTLEQELAMTKYPNQPLKAYSDDWTAVVKTIYDYEDFGPELNKTGYFEEDVAVLVKNLNTPEEKINAIFNFVKATVKWNNYLGYSCNDGVRKAYKEKVGNVAELNLMLTAMLRFAGLNANPVLVSTRSNGIAIFPNRTAFNYVIATVESPSGKILLDATDKYSTPDVLPFRALNWVGRLIRKDGTSEEVDLMPKKHSNDLITMNYGITDDGNISGKIRRQRSDYNAMTFRNSYVNLKEDSYVEKLENDNEKIEVADYVRANENDLPLPVVETFSFKGSNLYEKIGSSIYVNPLLFLTDKQNPFKQEVREFPIDFGFQFIDKYNVNINIPAGYKVESLPANGMVNMIDNLGSFKYLATVSGNMIQIAVACQVNTSIISTEGYSMLKEFYQKMIEKQNEKIILAKI